MMYFLRYNYNIENIKIQVLKQKNDIFYPFKLKKITKNDQKGHYLIKVDKFFPSSQLRQCGYKNPITEDLKVRDITCPICEAEYDRGLNAVINIGGRL